MKTLSNTLARIISASLFVFLAVLVAVTFFQVLCRFVFKFPAVWTEEVARMCFVWLILLGAAIGVREGSHLVLDMVTSALGPRARKLMQSLVLAMIIVLSGMFAYAGGNYCWRSRNKTAVTLPIPANSVYAAVPLSGVLMVLFGIEKLLSRNGEREGSN